MARQQHECVVNTQHGIRLSRGMCAVHVIENEDSIHLNLNYAQSTEDKVFAINKYVNETRCPATNAVQHFWFQFKIQRNGVVLMFFSFVTFCPAYSSQFRRNKFDRIYPVWRVRV